MQPPPIPNASPRELNTWFQERLQHAKQPAHGSRTVDRSSLFRTRSAMDVRSLAMRSRRWRVGVAGGVPRLFGLTLCVGTEAGKA